LDWICGISIYRSIVSEILGVGYQKGIASNHKAMSFRQVFYTLTVGKDLNDKREDKGE
jgi:hypothetical protein